MSQRRDAKMQIPAKEVSDLFWLANRGVLSQAPNFNPNPMRGRDFTARVKGAIEPYEEIRG